ncbi:ABC-type transport auxiliary lipoprotein family protein [Campylobacter volucris]|nr:ABC-type transport auxiliary lipoprotein family protein [Campylobacter volucris]
MKKIVLLFMALLFSACSVVSPSQTLPFARYFSISLDHNISTVNMQKDVTIMVALPKGLVYTNEIFYKKDGIVNTYAYHFWQDNLNLLIKNFLETSLENTKIFKAVLNQDSLAKTDFILESKVNVLEQDFINNEESIAKFGISLTLINMNDKNIVASRYFYYEKKLDESEPELLMQVYNEIFSQFNQDLNSWMGQILE